MSDLVVIANKDSLESLGLGKGKADCVRPCIGISFGAKNSIIEYARDFALQNGYEVVALVDSKESLFGMKYSARLDFYNFSKD